MKLVKRPAEQAAPAPAPVVRQVVKSAPVVGAVQVPLHIKYRPKTLDDVLGQQHAVENLRTLFAGGRIQHTFMFTGPSGTGKTTLARILASMTDCSDVIEHDAARFNSIEAVRRLVEGAQYGALGDNARKFIIIDECQRISRTAFDVLLKATEEPPEHLYWAFCTTEPDKVPTTLRTRSHAYDLKPVPWDSLADYLVWVCEQERGALNVMPDFIDIAARQANGSPRQALVFLSMLDGITDRQHALKLVEDYEAQETGPIELARMLVSDTKGASWANAIKLMATFDDSAETIRLTVLNYTTGALAKEASPQRARKLLAIVQNFAFPCNPSERMAPIYLALGNLLLGE